MIARPPFRERDARHTNGRFDVRIGARILDLEAEEEFTVRVQRPRIGDPHVILGTHSPHPRRIRLRTVASRALRETVNAWAENGDQVVSMPLRVPTVERPPFDPDLEVYRYNVT